MKYKALHEGKPVLVDVSRDEIPENPLELSHPMTDHRPLFVMPNKRYDLGDKGAEATAWELLKDTAKWDPDWLEEEIITRHGVKIHHSRLRNTSIGSFELRIGDDDMWVYMEIDDEEFKWEDNPDFLGEDIHGLIKAAQMCDAHIVPVYLLNHSGIYLSLRSDYPFDCPWDAGCCGFILWTQEEFEKYGGGDADEYIRSYFDEYRAYVEGEVYCVTVVDPAPALELVARHRSQPPALEDLDQMDLKTCFRYGDIVDSCGGLVGWEYVRNNLTEMFDLTEVEEI